MSFLKSERGSYDELCENEHEREIALKAFSKFALRDQRSVITRLFVEIELLREEVKSLTDVLGQKFLIDIETGETLDVTLKKEDDINRFLAENKQLVLINRQPKKEQDAQ